MSCRTRTHVTEVGVYLKSLRWGLSTDSDALQKLLKSLAARDLFALRRSRP